MKKSLLIMLCVLCTILSLKAKESVIPAAEREPAGRFVLPAFKGDDQSLTTLSGPIDDRKVVLLSFFATYCKPCVNEVDYLVDIQNRYKGKPVEIVYVSIQGTSSIRKALKKGDSAFDPATMKKVTDNFPVMIDEKRTLYKALMQSGDSISVPATVILDQSRRVALRSRGFEGENEFVTGLTNAIDALLKEQPADLRNGAGQVTLVFSASVSGARSRLAQRKALYADLADMHGDMVLCSTGDYSRVESTPEKSAAVFKQVKSLGYDAIVPGDQEFTGGIEAVGTSGLPWTACNMTAKGVKIKKSLVVKKNGLKIGITGVIDPTAFTYSDKSVKSAVVIDTNWQKALKTEVDSLRKKGVGSVIVLAHGGSDFIGEIAKKVNGIDMIAGGHTQEELFETSPGKPVLLQSGAAGKQIYVVTWDTKKKAVVQQSLETVAELD
jgi:thiol-disulfide isomerase/thioredoxin